MDKNIPRRSFLLTTAAAGGALAAGTDRADAQPDIKSSSNELIRIGAIALGDNSHLNYSIWAPIFNPVEPDRWPVRSTRMVISHVWDSRPTVAEAFAQKYSCETVKNYDDMVGKVDGMLFAGFNESPWWPQLTRPYLEAGIPCVINRPFALSMRNAYEMVERSQKYNAPIMAIDGREYIKEVSLARHKVAEIIRSGKSIIGVNSDNSSGYEYPQHGIHGLNFLAAILGCDVERVSLQADGWWRESLPGTAGKMNWGILSLQYRGITIDDDVVQKKPFVAVQQQLTGFGSNGNIRLYYDGGWDDIDNHWAVGEPMNRLYYYFFPSILQIQKFFETRKMPRDYDFILQKTKLFLTGFKSHLEHDGAMILVDDLPDDWEAPTPYPNWIDESIFT